MQKEHSRNSSNTEAKIFHAVGINHLISVDKNVQIATVRIMINKIMLELDYDGLKFTV